MRPEPSRRVPDNDLLGAYTLGVLDPGEVSAVDAHVASCAGCRQELAALAAMRDSLGQVPPEAFLDGPPEGGDLLLQRTLRAVRTGKAGAGRQRYALIAAGLVALATVAAGAGMLAGHAQASRQEALRTPAPAATATSVPFGVRTAAAIDDRTGARITATVTPAAGWVRVHADVGGIRAGQRCQLVVVPRRGAPVVAGSWLMSPRGQAEGTRLDGSALIDAADVAAIEVVTFDGETLVSAVA